MKNRILLLCLLAFCTSFIQPLSKEWKGKVVGIKDGDTIELLIDNKTTVVRLAHIDCPEMRKGQPYSRQAKKFTSDKCFGQNVTVINNGERDRYKRLIGVVVNENKENVNMELVKAGLAWHYTVYSSDPTYKNAENEAREARRGIWSEKNPIAPWLWRKPSH